MDTIALSPRTDDAERVREVHVPRGPWGRVRPAAEVIPPTQRPTDLGAFFQGVSDVVHDHMRY
ncbi:MULTISPECIES: hypothetical protein [unclassified Cellulosimicrobium]|uniref:Uncharacterized protein n=1 Tax=Cellulosimicrobium sp. ES-005 TaxID=3163031 RepID=A0AAU8FY03_9MICO|nr:hypothetical protein [Cellulosimicrobium sp. TH-20]